MDIFYWNNNAKNRYEAVEDNRVIGVAEYSYKNGFTISINRTMVNSNYNPHDIMPSLFEGLTNYANSINFKIETVCPYATEYFNMQGLAKRRLKGQEA